MKTNCRYLILIFVFSASICGAQNFKSIYPGITAHFSFINPNNPGKTFFNTISIDSVNGVINGNELFNFLSFDLSTTQCYSANRSTWIGQSIFQDNNGTEYFLNSDSDTIVIKPLDTIGSSWHLYNYSNGNYIEGLVTGINQENFLGLSDSAKTIQLTVKNSSGNVIANILNGKQVKISRNYGFVQTFGFKNFPTDTTLFTLAGLSNPQVGIMNLTADSIYDFNVGDEFHHHRETNCSIGLTDKYYSIERVLLKSFSLNNDTVYYLTERCHRYEHYDFINSVFYHSILFDTVSLPYTISTNARLNKFSYQLTDTPATSFQNTNNGFLEFYFDTTHNSRFKKVTHEYYYYDNSSNCFSLVIGQGIFLDKVFASGLGLVYSTDYNSCQVGNGVFDSLVCYKKGSELWGQPLNCSALLAVKDYDHQAEIILFPNPVSDYINLNIKGVNAGQQFHLTIKNLMSQLVLERDFETTSNTSLPVNDLTSGIYFLTVTSKEKIFKTLKFCKL